MNIIHTSPLAYRQPTHNTPQPVAEECQISRGRDASVLGFMHLFDLGPKHSREQYPVSAFSEAYIQMPGRSPKPCLLGAQRTQERSQGQREDLHGRFTVGPCRVCGCHKSHLGGRDCPHHPPSLEVLNFLPQWQNRPGSMAQCGFVTLCLSHL